MKRSKYLKMNIIQQGLQTHTKKACDVIVFIRHPKSIRQHKRQTYQLCHLWNISKVSSCEMSPLWHTPGRAVFQSSRRQCWALTCCAGSCRAAGLHTHTLSCTVSAGKSMHQTELGRGHLKALTGKSVSLTDPQNVSGSQLRWLCHTTVIPGQQSHKWLVQSGLQSWWELVKQWPKSSFVWR